MQREKPLSKKGQKAVVDFNEERMLEMVALANAEPWYRTNGNFIGTKFEDCLELFYIAGMDDDLRVAESKKNMVMN